MLALYEAPVYERDGDVPALGGHERPDVGEDARDGRRGDHDVQRAEAVREQPRGYAAERGPGVRDGHEVEGEVLVDAHERGADVDVCQDL